MAQQHLKNMLTIILDTDNTAAPVQMGKFELPTTDMATTMALDITTICEAAAVLIKAISAQTGSPREIVLHRTLEHIKHSSRNNGTVVITDAFEKNMKSLNDFYFSEN